MDIISLKYIINSVVYSGLGITILLLCYVILDWITPKVHIWEQLCDKQNIALAIFLGAGMVSIALIIASAIHG